MVIRKEISKCRVRNFSLSLCSNLFPYLVHNAVTGSDGLFLIIPARNALFCFNLLPCPAFTVSPVSRCSPLILLMWSKTNSTMMKQSTSSSLLLPLLLVLAAALSSGDGAGVKTEDLRNPPHSRDLQTTSAPTTAATAAGASLIPNFRASYVARFSHLLDENCSGPPPVFQVFCRGRVVAVSKSDESLEIRSVTDGLWSGLQLTSKCGSDGDGSDCDGVYIERGSSINAASTFAEVTFQCFGETERGVDAWISYLAGASGSCTGRGQGHNFHVAQLGVLCDTEFSFDDYHFECNLGAYQFKTEGGRYTCYEGTNCRGSSCTVEHETLIINADSQKFHECIESFNEQMVVPEEPALSSLQSPSPPGQYSAQFQASWQLALDTNQCNGDFAVKRISCLSDTSITLVEILYDNINCTFISESSMECIDTSAENFVNAFSGVNYVSIYSKCYVAERTRGIYLCSEGPGIQPQIRTSSLEPLFYRNVPDQSCPKPKWNIYLPIQSANRQRKSLSAICSSWVFFVKLKMILFTAILIISLNVGNPIALTLSMALIPVLPSTRFLLIHLSLPQFPCQL
jgi:hypothetical protein